MKIVTKLLATFVLINAVACQKESKTNQSNLTKEVSSSATELQKGGGKPTIKIVSPSSTAKVARGEGRSGAGSFNGTGFLVDLQIITHDEINVVAKEGLNI